MRYNSNSINMENSAPTLDRIRIVNVKCEIRNKLKTKSIKDVKCGGKHIKWALQQSWTYALYIKLGTLRGKNQRRLQNTRWNIG